MANADADLMQVEVVICMAAGEVRRVTLSLAAGRVVRDALLGSGLSVSAIGADTAVPRVGVWGQLRSLDHPLRDGDRVEVYRPLVIDPKDARRRRHRLQRRGPDASCNPTR